MRNKIYFTFFFLFTSILFSCSVKKKALKTQVHVKHHNANYLLKKLHKNETNFDFITMKAAVKVTEEGKNTRFHAYIRIRKDSAIWVSITPLFGIELARLLVTPDTVLFLDRIHNQYFAGNFDFLSDKLKADINFETLQALLIGNSTLPQKEKDLHASVDSLGYFLSEIRQRKYKKALKKDKENKLRRQTQILWLDTGTYKIRKMSLVDTKTNRSIDVSYKNFQKVNNQQLPSQLFVNIKANDTLTARIDYSKFVINKPKHMIFNIPKKYARIR